MAISDNQLNRTAAPEYEFELRVSMGPRRSYVDLANANAGEPVVLPVTLPLGNATITPTTTDIFLPLGYETSGYPDTGMINVSDGTRWGWWSYSGKTSDTFTGCQHEHGYTTFNAGATISAWREVTDRIDIDAVTITQWRERSFNRWACAMRGWQYDSRIFMPDASVLIEVRVTPEGAMGVWSDWLLMGVGYVREWTPTADADGLHPWVARVVDAGTYVLPHGITTRRYGRVNVSPGGTTTASPNLANPLLELLEWGEFGPGTTGAANTIDGNNDTGYISENVPSMVGETPGSTGGSQDPTIQQVVTQGVVQQPGLQYIEIAVAPDNPRYVSGIRMKDYFIRTKATVFRTVGGVPTVTGGTLYIRCPDITINADNPRFFLTNDLQKFDELYVLNVPRFDWTRLDGFGNDQTPARLLTLDPAGDIVQLRVEVNGVLPTVREMLAYGSVNPNGYWFVFDNQGHWDNSTVTAPGVGESIRRSPVFTDNNTTGNWIVETRPNPGDDRIDDDPAYISTEYNEWTAHPASAMTNVSPPTGGNLVLDDATNCDDVRGVILLDAEKVFYSYRDDTTLYNIIRGYGGTTAASHTTGALVYQFGRSEPLHLGLDVYMSAVSPPNGGVIYFPTTAPLPTNGKVWLNNECISYTGKTAGTITGITRAVDGTTAAEHLVGTLVHLFDEDLGAHRFPLVATVELRRWARYIPSTNTYIVADVFEVWGSVVGSPKYYGESDYRLDWIGEGPLVRVVLTPNQYTLQLPIDLPKPMRLRHRKVMIHHMSDGGRAKVNEILDWRAQVTAAPNGEGGIGAPIRDMIQEVLTESEVITVGTVGGGSVFQGTNGDVTIAEDELGNILDEFAQQYSLLYTFTLDGKMTLGRDYFHPRGRYPDVTAVLDYQHIAAGMEVTIPSLFDVGQVVVEMIDPKLGSRCEGRYPPLPGPGRIVRLPPLITSFASPANALAYATQAYFSNPKISREFRFETMGPAEWMRNGQRLYVRDTSDEADEDSGGRLWNVAVQQVEMTSAGNARVVAQEWRIP